MHVEKISNTEQNIRRLSQLKSDSAFSYMIGSYKNHVKAQRAYATEAVKNFELAKKAPFPQFKNIPCFCKMGMRILLFSMLDKLRIKSKDEKLFKVLVRADKAISKCVK